MSKKLSNGEKKELQLHFRFKQLKRIGKIPKDMSLNKFRESEFNEYVSSFRRVKYTKPVVKIQVEKFIPFKTIAERRKQRKAVKHLILVETQKAKKSRKEKIKERRLAKEYKQFRPCKAA